MPRPEAFLRIGALLAAFCGCDLALVCAGAGGADLRDRPAWQTNRSARTGYQAQILSGFNGGRAFEDLKHLVSLGPRPPGSKALSDTRAWMESELKQAGCSVEEDAFTASTPVGNIPMFNLIAKAPGEKPGVLMLAGHYDTGRHADFKFVGANDGGSSAAVLLDLARVFCRRKNGFNIWLVFFDGEEALVNWTDTDSLYGSRHLAAKLAGDGEIARIQAMILVDMVGDKHLVIEKDANSTPWLTDLVFRTAAKLGYGKQFPDEKAAVSDDHEPFVNDGVAAVDLLGNVGPPAAGSPFGKYWHTAEDTLDKCSPTSLTIVGRVVVATVEQLEREPRPH